MARILKRNIIDIKITSFYGFKGLCIFILSTALKSFTLFVYRIRFQIKAVEVIIESPTDKLYFLLRYIASSIISLDTGIIVTIENNELKYCSCSTVILE